MLLLDGALGAGVGDLADPSLEVRELARRRGGVDVLRDVGAADGLGVALGHAPSLALPSWTRCTDPDRSASDPSHPATPWAPVEVFDRLGSTNDEVRARPAPWRVVVAEVQDAGRGRLGRAWTTTPGTALAVSVLVPPPASGASWVPLLAGLAVHRAVEEVAGVVTALKWPNDVLVPATTTASSPACSASGPRPASSSGSASTSTPPAATCPSTPPPRCGPPGAPGVDRATLLTAYLVHLARVLARTPAPAAAPSPPTSPPAATVGRDVEVHEPGGVVRHGVATGVDDAGRLTVRSAEGGLPCPPATSSTSGHADRSERRPDVPAGCRPAPRRRDAGRRAGRSSGCCSAAPPRWDAARCPRGPASRPRRPAGSGTRWASRTPRTRAMFTEADLEALRRVARMISDEPGQRGARAGHDPGLRPHLRPARRVADPARGGVADLPVLRGARGPRQPLGARAAGRRRRRRAARVDLRRHRAAARLRLAAPPHQRDRPHARGCRPDGALRPVRADPGRRLRRPGLVHLASCAG